MNRTTAALLTLTFALIIWADFTHASGATQDLRDTQESLALTYPEGKTVTLKLKGTARLPQAKGEAKIERKKGATEVEIELDEMKPAALFGGDFNTYVLWSVSPEGYATNLGEFVLQGNRSKLNVSTRLETFGLFVTAEPHYLVRSPSRFVVLENTRPTQELKTPLQTSQIRYRGYQGLYNFERESLDTAAETRGEQRSELQQGRTAVSLAERAQAEKYALPKLTEARLALRKTEEAVRGNVDKKQISILGRETVRLAFEAQQQAEAEKLAEEKRAQEAEGTRLQAEAADANRRAAEETAKREEAARRAEEAARLAAEEAQKRELAARQAEEAARLAQEAAKRAEEAARQAAEEIARRKQAEAAAAQAAAEAERAASEREEARLRMQRALGLVAETRESARGIIVNLPDILFDFNEATLRPEAREVISRIAGILMVTPGFRLKVEGHTDSIGTDEYNQKLSEKRADAVRDYLTSANISRDLIATKGFGKTQPIADNNTAEGRKRNRRVEIIIEDAGVPEP